MRRASKTSWLTRMMSAVLIGCLALGMTACGGDKNGGNSSNSSVSAKNAVFREQKIDLNMEHGISDLNNVTMSGDRIYGMSTAYEENKETTYLISFLTDGSDIRYTVLRTVEYPSYNEGMAVEDFEAAISSALPAGGPEVDAAAEGETDDAEETASEEETETPDAGIEPRTAEVSGETDAAAETGKPAADEPAADEPAADETADEPGADISDDMAYTSVWYNGMALDQNHLYLLEDSYTSSEDSYSEKYSLICMDLDANELWRVELGGTSAEDMSGFYAGSMLGLDDGVLLRTDRGEETLVSVYDSTGNLVSSTPVEVGSPNFFFRSPKGDILMQYYTETDYTQWMATYDPQTGAVGEPFQIPGVNEWNYNINTGVFGGSYDLYYTSGQSLYGYTMGAEAGVEIMNYIDSDIDSRYTRNLLILDDENLLMTQYDYEANDYAGAFYLSALTKVAPEDVVDKIILQLACYSNMYSIRSDVIKFNKTNDTYRIKLVDYSTYSTKDDWEAGLNKMNNDIIYGNGPDIIYLNESMPVNTYISKGVLADLYPLIDNDPDLNREDFLSNILDVYSVDGKLYQMVPRFNLMTLVAKSKFVGTEPGWTVEEMIEFAKNADPSASLFETTIASDFLSMILNYSGEEWIDWEKGTCNFNTQSFIDLLEFSATLPKDYSAYEEMWNDEDYWSSYESMYREDRTLLDALYLSNFRYYQQLRYATFGEDITMIGYPMSEGNGAVVTASMSLAITSSCKNQDGAWSFIRQYLLDEYQDTISYDFPITVRRMDVLKEEAKQRPYYEDENGNKIEYDDTYWVGDKEVVVPVMTDEDIEKVYSIISNASTLYHYDSSLMEIITEEVEPFYAGQKTAAAVAEIIQSRASIYISENQ